MTPPGGPTIEHCMLHPFEVADRLCVGCGNWHCDACLVTPWGARKGALCVACAIERGGVRKGSSARSSRTRAEIRQAEKQRQRQGREEDRNPVVISAANVPVADEPEPPRSRFRFRRG